MVAMVARLAAAGEARCSRRRVPMPRQRPQRPKLTTRETSLYLPVKRFLEGFGFEVKGEICGCDLVAIRGDAPPLVVIGALKLGFNLELVLHAIHQLSASALAWLSVPFSRRIGSH